MGINKKVNCLMCDTPEPAVYIRCTQFAGDHPLCEEHAKQDTDFMIDDSYAYWVVIDQNIVSTVHVASKGK